MFEVWHTKIDVQSFQLLHQALYGRLFISFICSKCVRKCTSLLGHHYHPLLNLSSETAVDDDNGNIDPGSIDMRNLTLMSALSALSLFSVGWGGALISFRDGRGVMRVVLDKMMMRKTGKDTDKEN
ncbi:hypothetical protein HDU76_013552 [Blyttiomyces sp. JEL0837]|nr:hypothetical protein HDU76_013552 [Blyttiomyces sp. JEL0837]